MTYRVGLTSSSSSSLTTILNTLEEITNLSPTAAAAAEATAKDVQRMIEEKQNSLKSCIKSLRNEMETNNKNANNNNNKDDDDDENKNSTERKERQYEIIIPLSSISNASTILKHYQQHCATRNVTNLKQQLEQNLKQNTKLSFPSSSSSSSSSSSHRNSSSTSSSSSNSLTTLSKEEKEAYQKRIEYLKLNIEERKYTKLTSNLDTTPKDDATLSSMLYASSVGMNMIVAPISIGVLMYFFAGKLMLWIFGSGDSTSGDSAEEYIRTSRTRNNNGQLNIHGVIVGVISGVIMLFIEMILFVIRNHEMDKHVTEKKKKCKKNPFGYDANTAKRTFHG